MWGLGRRGIKETTRPIKWHKRKTGYRGELGTGLCKTGAVYLCVSLCVCVCVSVWVLFCVFFLCVSSCVYVVCYFARVAFCLFIRLYVCIFVCLVDLYAPMSLSACFLFQLFVSTLLNQKVTIFFPLLNSNIWKKLLFMYCTSSCI